MKITELDLKTEGKRYKWENNILIVKNGDLLEIATNTYLRNFCIPTAELLEMEYEEVKEMKNPYARVANEGFYHAIEREGNINWMTDDSAYDDRMFDIANYFNNKEYAKYISFKETLMRRMDKFAWENNDKVIDWNDDSYSKYYIKFSNKHNEFIIEWSCLHQSNNIYFTSREIAVKALKEFEDDLRKLYTWSFDF